MTWLRGAGLDATSLGAARLGKARQWLYFHDPRTDPNPAPATIPRRGWAFVSRVRLPAFLRRVDAAASRRQDRPTAAVPELRKAGYNDGESDRMKVFTNNSTASEITIETLRQAVEKLEAVPKIWFDEIKVHPTRYDKLKAALSVADGLCPDTFFGGHCVIVTPDWRVAPWQVSYWMRGEHVKTDDDCGRKTPTIEWKFTDA